MKNRSFIFTYNRTDFLANSILGLPHFKRLFIFLKGNMVCVCVCVNMCLSAATCICTQTCTKSEAYVMHTV